MTRFVDVSAMSHLIQQLGAARFIGELADTIRADFVRWEEFEKSARLASHSEVGVIELMPVANSKTYAFKEDYSALRYVLAQAELHQVGEMIELVPSTDDPKDLFCLTRKGSARVVLRKVG